MLIKEKSSTAQHGPAIAATNGQQPELRGEILI
jgi:hypothetical protein